MAAPAPSRPSHILFIRLCHFLALFLCATILQAGPKWEPISKEELADNKPHIDPEAGAEILFRKVVMDHATVYSSKDTYYIRAKIYSARGIEDLSKIDIEYGTKAIVSGIVARTIKPDGTIIELKSEEIFEREIIKHGSERWRSKSFALPGLEPGAIVEYRYTVFDDDTHYFTRIIFQTELPAQSVQYRLYIKSPGARWPIRAMAFNCSYSAFEMDSDGYYSFARTNVPAAKKEDFSPPRINTTIGLLIYPSEFTGEEPKEYWRDQSLVLHSELEITTWPSKTIRTVLASIVSPGDTSLNKLAKIHDYCRSKVTNYDHDPVAAKKRKPKNPEDKVTAAATLKAGAGDPEDINTLFAALARAAGFEVNFTNCSDRSVLLFRPDCVEPWITPKRVIAVSVDGAWHYYDPGSKFLPAGALNWKNSDTAALVSDAKRKGELRILAGSMAEENTRNRKATLMLDEEGTLEGEVTETYSGQWEAELKVSFESETPTKQEKFVREAIQRYQRMAELSAITVENSEEPLAPLRISYHLRIPNYAEKTGSRLFFQPAVFQKGMSPLFANATRQTDLLFNYRFVEKDEVRIEFPNGFRLEQASAPGPLDLGELGSYENQISILSKGSALSSVRTYRQTSVAIAKSFYPALIAAFQGINKRDNHTLTLKRREPVTLPQPAVAPPEVSTPDAGAKNN